MTVMRLCGRFLLFLMILHIIVAFDQGIDEDDEDFYTDRVTNLPYWGPVENNQFAGYIPIDEEQDSHLFYWFIAKNTTTPSSTIVWVNGGQGCSSFIGAFGGIGPKILRESENGTFELQSNPFSWTHLANVLFIDQPVGTGYSTTTREGLATNQNQIKEQLYTALCYFFGYLHPEYAPKTGSPLFIAGDSYGGKYIPPIASRVAEGGDYRTSDGSLEACVDLKLNGIAIGNGFVDPYWQLTASPEQAYANGFIGTFQLKQAEAKARACERALLLGETDKISGEIHPCEEINQFIHTAAGNFSNYDLREWDDKLNRSLISDYMNSADVRSALHADGKNNLFVACNDTVKVAMTNDTYISQMQTVADLLSSVQLRILFYSGQFDMQVSTLSTTRWLRAMNWGGKSVFAAAPRLQWITDEGKIGGYIQSSLGLSFLTIVQSGHLVAIDQPHLTSEMMRIFIANEPFARDTDGTFTNELCGFFDNCGDSTGTCVQGRCVCVPDYAGFDCSFAINEITVLTNDTFQDSKTLNPYTWEYYSFNLVEQSDIVIDVVGPEYSIYIQNAHAPTLDDFDILFSLSGRTSKAIKTDFLKGDWFVGVYNNGAAAQSYSILISKNETQNIQPDYHSNNSSLGYYDSLSGLPSEKSALVWIVTCLSLLLLFSLLVIILMIFILIKQATTKKDNLNWQGWQDDDLNE